MTRWRPPPSDPLVRLADEAVHGTEVRSRIAERAGRDRAADTASFLGALRDLAERRMPVALRVTGGRSHRGVLSAVALDHVALSGSGGMVTLVVLDAIRAVRLEPEVVHPPATGDRPAAQDRTFLEALDRLRDRGEPLSVWLSELPDRRRGTVTGLGDDVLSLELEGRDRATVLVPLHAVTEVVWAP